MQGGEECVEAGYTGRKFVTMQGVTNILAITAKLGRLNEASQWNVRSKCWTDEIRSVQKFRRKGMSNLLSMTTNRRSF